MKRLLLSFLLGLIISQAFAQSQNIRGQIIDQQSKSPLIGASVIIVGSDPLIGGTTDVEGYFELKNVSIGRVALKISYLGYEEQFLPNILVTSGKEVSLNVALVEQVLQGEEIVILAEEDKTQLNNEMATLSARGFTIEETSRYAGSRNDPARMASNFAGVSGANDARNDIVIRGNSPTGVLWRFEGIDIPSPNHFGTLGTTGGPVGMLNNNVLANSDFFTGAYPADYGNANAGAFDIKMRTGNRSKREYLFQIGFSGFEAGLEGPFSKGKKATYLVNYRYSTLGVFNALGFSFGTGTAVPQYQDMSFKIDLPTNKAGRFSIFGLGGMSSINLLGSDQKKPDPNDNFGDINQDSRVNAAMGVIGVKHIYYFNSNTYSEITIAASGSSNKFTQDSLNRSTGGEVVNKIFSNSVNNQQWKYSSRIQITKKFNARNTMSVGMILDNVNLSLSDSTLNRPGTTFRVNTNFEGSSFLVQAYLQWQHRFGDKLTLNSGVHYQQFLLNNSNAFEPRLGLKYQITPKQSLSIGYGLHHQLQPLQVYFQEVGNGSKFRSNEKLDFTQSQHFVLGYNNNISNTLRVRVEAYYQSIRNAAVESTPSSFSLLNSGADFGTPNANYLVNNGTGYNYGVEFTLEKFYSNHFYFLFTTSLFESRYKGSDGMERNTAFNGNYVANLLGGYEFSISPKSTIFMDTKVTVAGGRRFTPIDLNASNANGYTVTDNTRAFSEQYPDYFRLDFKIGYRLNAKKVTHEFFVDVQNITNQKNVFTKQYNRTAQTIGNTYQLGLFPVVQYRLTF